MFCTAYASPIPQKRKPLVKPLPTNPIEKPGPTYVAARLPNTNASGSARPANENSENCRAARARTATNVSTVT